MTHSQIHHSDGNAESAKFDPGTGDFPIDAGPALPDGYGDNRIVIMARDPFWLFAYWEITHERAEQIRGAHGKDIWDRSVLVLRVFDLGDSSPLPILSAPSFDIQVDTFARQWYVQIPYPGHFYVIDLGLRTPDGSFISLFRSNMIRQPAGTVSNRFDSQWMSVDMTMEQQSWERMAMAAIGAGNTKGSSGGVESGKDMTLRWEFLKSVFSGSVTRWPGSSSSSRLSPLPDDSQP